MKKFYTINGMKVAPMATRYATTNNLAIKLVCADGEPWAILTVNFDKLDDPSVAFVDINNVPDAEQFIIENGLGEKLEYYQPSGWCVYPLFKFNLDKLNILK